MNRYLSLFVDSSTDLDDSRSGISRLGHRRGFSSSSHRSIEENSQLRRSGRRTSNETASEAVSPNHAKPPKEESTSDKKKKEGEHQNFKIFQDAAQTLLRSLELEEGGGVVFMDSHARVSAGLESDTKSLREKSISPLQRRGSMVSVSKADIIAWSTSESPQGGQVESTDEDDGEEPSFSALSVDALNTLVSRYPQGKLWTFDASGSFVSDSEEDTLSGDVKTQAEAAILRQFFPGAAQIMSVPIWDSGLSRRSVCFVYTTSRFRFFSVETELLFVMAFCSCVTMELARLASIAADQLKSGKQ